MIFFCACVCVAQIDHVRPVQHKCRLILLDNASIHSCHEFVRRLTLRAAIVKYIPPYCYFLSPLDNGAFGALVTWLRKHRDYVQRVGIERALEAGMHALNGDGGRLARHCFRNCKYL